MGMSRSPKNGKQAVRRGTPNSPVVLKSTLSEDERIWVIGLQEELRKIPDLDGISDWDIVCHAVVAKSDSAKAIQRLRRLKQFQQIYKVPEHPTVYEAIRTMHDFCHAHPDFIQAIGCDASGRWVLSFQLKAWTCSDQQEQGQLSAERDFAALYFLLMALQPDLESVRKGTIWIGDLEGITCQTLPLSSVRGARALCREAFPIRVEDAPCWNTPPKLSAVYAFCRPCFSPHLTEKIVWDCTPELLTKYFPKHVLCKALGGTQSRNEVMDVLEANLVRWFEYRETFRLNIK